MMGGEMVIPDLMAARLMNTMTEYISNEVTSVIQNGFSYQTKLELVVLPNCTALQAGAFYGCSELSVLSLPKLKSIQNNAFRNCKSLTEFITGSTFDSRLDESTFQGCSGLTKADFYHINNLGISGYALACENLTTLIIRNADFVPSLTKTAFGAETTKMNTGEGKIYVPASMIDAYKAAANWSNYADQIYSLEELTYERDKYNLDRQTA